MVPLASLVSYRVLNYPMGALIELDTLLIVSLDEGEIEGRKGDHSRAAKQSRKGTTTSAESGTRVSVADSCTQLVLDMYLHVFVGGWVGGWMSVNLFSLLMFTKCEIRLG